MKKEGASLPVFTTDTEEEANSLVILFGSVCTVGRSRDLWRVYLPMQRARNAEESMHLMHELSDKMAEAYTRMKKRKT